MRPALANLRDATSPAAAAAGPRIRRRSTMRRHKSRSAKRRKSNRHRRDWKSQQPHENKRSPPILIGRYIALACTNYAWPAASSIGLPAVGGQSCLCSELRKGAIRDERSEIPDGITQAAFFVAGFDRKIALGGMDHDVETSTLS